MKNKNILHKIILGGFYFTALVSMSSCNPLGIEPTTMVDKDRFWENPQLTREYVNNFYTWTPTGSGQNFQSEQWSDNCQGNYEKDWNTYNQYPFYNRRYDTETSISSLDITKMWQDSYKHIRAINIGIEKITSSTVITDAVKNQTLGECHFFRAWEYFEMEKYWGPVPYVEKSLDINDETFLPRIKREQLFDNILNDLTKAAKYFADYGGKPQTGMVNADVVEAFRSRVALYAACAAEASEKGLYSFDDKDRLFTFSKASSTYYEIAYNAAKSLIGGKYSLEPNYEDLFTKTSAHKSVESIWPVMFDKANRSGFNPTGVNGPDGEYYGNSEERSISWDLRSGLFPTQDLVDCYLQKDVDGQWKNWWETKQAQDMGVTISPIDGKVKGESADYRKMFENRDKRFYATVTYDGAYMGPKEERYIMQSWIDNTNPTGDKTSFKYSALHTGYRQTTDNMKSAPNGRGSTQTITGYYSRKYTHYDKFTTDGKLDTEQRSTCYFNIRYAEILLNCAEASIKLNKGDAKTYIDDIRTIHGGLNPYNGSDLMAELKLQKRLEFAFECPGFRYFDLLRWSESEGLTVIPELNRPSKGLWIFRKGVESDKAGENGYPVVLGGNGYITPHFETADMDYENYKRKFDHPRFYFLPFFQTIMTSYTGLVQNPGWADYKYTN